MHEKLQALKELSIVGDYVKYEQDRLRFLLDHITTDGPVIRYSEFVYMVAESDLCEHILLRTNQDFVTPDLETIAGSTNLDYDGEHIVEQWKKGRPGLIKGLHPRTISPHIEDLIAIINAHIAHWHTGQRIAVYDEMQKIASQTAVHYLFGTRGYPFLNIFNQFLDAHFAVLNSSFSFPRWLPTPLSLRWQARSKKFGEALRALIREERLHPSASASLLSFLVSTPDAQGHPFSDTSIQGTMTAMLFQSAHTTFAALSWIWYLLASHPEQEHAMSMEIQQILGDRLPTRYDLPHLIYLESVVKEALRLYPPVWQLTRDTLRTCQAQHYMCEKGQRLYLNLYSVHRNPHIFTEPDDFKPDRWLNEEQDREGQRKSYFPFGLGPRKCLGSSFAMTELLLITLLIARQFRLHLDHARHVRVSPDIVLRPRGLKMRLEKRQPPGNIG